MALTSVHILCLYVSGLDESSDKIPIGGDLVWSQTMAAPGTTTLAAPAHMDGSDPAYEISSGVDIYFAKGNAPDASQTSGTTASTARRLLPGTVGQVRGFMKPGEKIAWVLA